MTPGTAAAVGGAVALRARTGGPLAAVLARLVGALAAAADLPVDRLSEAQLAASALVHAATERGDERMEVVLDTGVGCVWLYIGPMATGQAHDLLRRASVPDLGPLIERLTDEARVESVPGGERLVVVVGAANGGPG